MVQANIPLQLLLADGALLTARIPLVGPFRFLGLRELLQVLGHGFLDQIGRVQALVGGQLLETELGVGVKGDCFAFCLLNGRGAISFSASSPWLGSENIASRSAMEVEVEDWGGDRWLKSGPPYPAASASPFSATHWGSNSRER